MNEIIEITPGLIDLELTQTDRTEALRYLVGLLEKQNYVPHEYMKKVVDREASYPTGLRFANIAIAIPHGDSECVLKSSIAVGRCKNKMAFHSMEEPSDLINVDLIVLLAIKDPKSHLTILNNLMEMFSKKEICDRLLQEDSPEAVCEIFRSSLY